MNDPQNEARLVDRYLFLTSNIAALKEELETVREALIADGEGAKVGTKDAVRITRRAMFKKALAEKLLTPAEKEAASEMTITAKAAKATLSPERYNQLTEDIFVVKGVSFND